MSRYSTFMRLPCIAGLVGLLAAVSGAGTASAQSVNDMVRTLNNVLNPGDAQRLEDQARRSGRPQEERYLRDYRAGLESPGRYPREYRDQDPRDYTGRYDYRDRRGDPFQARAATSVTMATNEITATIRAES